MFGFKWQFLTRRCLRRFVNPAVIIVLLAVCISGDENVGWATSGVTDARQLASRGETDEDDVNVLGSSQLFLPLIVGNGSAKVIHEERPPTLVLASAPNTGHSGNSPETPPLPTNHTFVTDTGGHLDQYLGRSDLPGGLLKFQIGINAVFHQSGWLSKDKRRPEIIPLGYISHPLQVLRRF